MDGGCPVRRLRGLEPFRADVRPGFGQGGHRLLDAGVNDVRGLVLVESHDTAQIQTGCGGRGALGVAEYGELEAAVGGRQLHAGGGQGKFRPELGGVGVRGALENGGGGDPAGGALGGKHQPEVGAAVLDAGDTVGQEADADDALAGAEAAGHRRVGGGIQGDVLIQRQQIVVPAEQLRLLSDGAEQQLSRPVVCIVGGPEQLLIPEVQQLGPARGGIDRHALEHIPVDDEAQRIHADAVPETLRVAV